MRGYVVIISAICIIVNAPVGSSRPTTDGNGLIKSEGFLPMSEKLIQRIEELKISFDTATYNDESPVLTQRVVAASFMESIHVSPAYQCSLRAPLSKLADEILEYNLNNGDEKEVAAIVALITSSKIMKRVTKIMPKNSDKVTLFKFLGCLYQDVLQRGLIDAVPQLEVPNQVKVKSRCRNQNLPSIAEEGCNILKMYEEDDHYVKRALCGGVCILVGTLITSVVSQVIAGESGRVANEATLKMERQRLEMDRVRFLAEHPPAEFASHELRYQERLSEHRLPLNFLIEYENATPSYYVSNDNRTALYKREIDLYARLVTKISKVHAEALAGHRQGGLFMFVLKKLNFPWKFATSLADRLTEISEGHKERYDPDGLGHGDDLLMRPIIIDQSTGGVPFIKGCLGLCDPMLSEISSWEDKTVTAVGYTKHPTNSQRVTVEEDTTLKYQFGLVLAMPEQFVYKRNVPYDYLIY